MEPKCRKIAEQMGFELVEVALDREPGGKNLRIYIDKPGGITLDDCEVYHKAVRPLVENYDYDYMEVSSPGADRPLKTPRDFEKAIGQKVEVRLYAPLNGQKQHMGTLVSFDIASVTIDSNGETQTFEMKSIALIKLYPDIDSELAENT